MADLIIQIIFIITMIFLGLSFILVVFCVLPLKYVLRVSYKDLVLKIDFNYLFFSFAFFVDFNAPLSYKAIIMGKVITDSENKTEDVDDGVDMSKDSFIQNKDLDKEINVKKSDFKDLFERARELGKEKDLEIKESINNDKKTKIKGIVKDQIDEFFEKLHELLEEKLSLKFIKALKLIVGEAFAYYYYILPDKVEADIEFGLDDPYIVGNILAFLSPLYAKYGDSIKVKSHFKDVAPILDIYAMGRPQIIFMIIPISNLFLKKEFRDLF